MSFNSGNRSFFPPRGLSFRWWERAFTAEWLGPLWFSIKLGSLTALIATLLALPMAFALHRYRFRGRDALVAMTLGPLMLPSLVTGVGLLQLFELLGLREYVGFTALLVGHAVICMPFAVRTVARMNDHHMRRHRHHGHGGKRCGIPAQVRKQGRIASVIHGVRR